MAQRNRGVHADRLWREAINKAVHELVDDPRGDPLYPRRVKALRLIARKVVDEALEGNMAAIQEIGNRMDGRAPQTIKAAIDHTIQAPNEDERAKADALLALLDAPTIEGESVGQEALADRTEDKD